MEAEDQPAPDVLLTSSRPDSETGPVLLVQCWVLLKLQMVWMDKDLVVRYLIPLPDCNAGYI